MSTVTLTGADANGGGWPLASGDYTAFYLVDDGYTSLGSVGFTVK
jgi:hypothetical protein